MFLIFLVLFFLKSSSLLYIFPFSDVRSTICWMIMYTPLISGTRRNKTLPSWGSWWIPWTCCNWRAHSKSSDHRSCGRGHDCKGCCYTEIEGKNPGNRSCPASLEESVIWYLLQIFCQKFFRSRVCISSVSP